MLLTSLIGQSRLHRYCRPVNNVFGICVAICWEPTPLKLITLNGTVKHGEFSRLCLLCSYPFILTPLPPEPSPANHTGHAHIRDHICDLITVAMLRVCINTAMLLYILPRPVHLFNKYGKLMTKQKENIINNNKYMLVQVRCITYNNGRLVFVNINPSSSRLN